MGLILIWFRSGVWVVDLGFGVWFGQGLWVWVWCVGLGFVTVVWVLVWGWVCIWMTGLDMGSVCWFKLRFDCQAGVLFGLLVFGFGFELG